MASAFTPVKPRVLLIADPNEYPEILQKITSDSSTQSFPVYFIELEGERRQPKTLCAFNLSIPAQWNAFVSSHKKQYHQVIFGPAAYQNFATDAGVLAGNCNNFTEILAAKGKVLVPFSGFVSLNIESGSYVLHADNKARLSKAKEYFISLGLSLVTQHYKDTVVASFPEISKSKFFTGGLFSFKDHLVWWPGVRL
jgi:hypothetical protein